MPKKKLVIPVLLIVIALFATACSSTIAASPTSTANETGSELVEVALNDQAQEEAQPAARAAQIPIDPGLLAAYGEIWNAEQPR